MRLAPVQSAWRKTWLVVLFFIMGVGLWAWYSLGRATPAAVVTPGSPAPDFRLPSLTGEEVALSSLKGRPVLVNFWATWCPSCVQEVPELEAFYRRHRGEGLVLLAVNVMQRDTPETIAAFVREKGLTFPVLLDAGSEVSQRYQVAYLPTTYLIDRRGVIRFRYVGPLTTAQLEAWWENLARAEQ